MERKCDNCIYRNCSAYSGPCYDCFSIEEHPNFKPKSWAGVRMFEQLMDETKADDEEIMIYIVLGAAQAFKMALIDMDDCTRQRAEVIRDVAKRIFTERKNENE